MIFWKVISGIGAISFITTGLRIEFDPNCDSVGFSGGRAVLATCYPDSSGTFPGGVAGVGLILVGVVIILFAFPELDRLWNSDRQPKTEPKRTQVPKSYERKPATQYNPTSGNFKIKLCKDCKQRIPMNYEMCFECKGTNLHIMPANLSTIIEVEAQEQESQVSQELPGTKICPMCAEEIKFAARKCRYCGSMISD